jgi:hypothetical protein
MWNRGLRIIWLKIQLQNGKNFRLSLPISLNVLMELLDGALDLMTMICMVAPKKPHSASHVSAHSIKELTQLLMILFGSITKDGGYDLVEVSADHVNVSIKVK